MGREIRGTNGNMDRLITLKWDGINCDAKAVEWSRSPRKAFQGSHVPQPITCKRFFLAPFPFKLCMI